MKNYTPHLAFLLLMIIFLQPESLQALKVFGPNGTMLNFSTPAFTGNKVSIKSGEIVSYIGLIGFTEKELQRCDRVNPEAVVNQSIAVVAPYGGCSIERHIEVAQEAGALAVIIVTDPMWQLCNYIDTSSSKFKNTIPAVCLSGQDARVLLNLVLENGNKNPPEPTIAIFTEEPNEFFQMNKAGMNFVSIFFFINFIILAIVALIKLIYFWKVEGFMLTTPKFLVGLVFYIGITFSLNALDIMGFRKTWYANIMQFDITSTILFSPSIMFNVMILAADIWNVLARVSPYKKKMEILIYTSLAVLMLFYTTVDVTFAVYGYRYNLNKQIGDTLNWVIIAILIICTLSYILAGSFLLYRLSSFSKGMNKYQGNKKYKVLAICLLISFFATSSAVVVLILQTRKSIQNNPRSYLATTIVLFIAEIVFSYVILVIYNPNTRKNHPSSASFRGSMNTNFDKRFINLNKSMTSLDEKDSASERVN